jgi:hypothetical protein
MAQADTLSYRGDDRGFFAPGVFGVSTLEHMAINLGSGLITLGRVDEGLQVLATASAPEAKWQSVAMINTAAAFVLIDEPERACTALLTATGYGMDSRRIRGVRTQFPARWDPLACVHELDERLRLIP